jgi:hypothetical protein
MFYRPSRKELVAVEPPSSSETYINQPGAGGLGLDVDSNAPVGLCLQVVPGDRTLDQRRRSPNVVEDEVHRSPVETSHVCCLEVSKMRRLLACVVDSPDEPGVSRSSIF